MMKDCMPIEEKEEKDLRKMVMQNSRDLHGRLAKIKCKWQKQMPVCRCANPL